MSADPNSLTFRTAAADNMAEIARALDALIMLKDMVAKGLLPAGTASDCAMLRDALSARAAELRNPDGFVSESGHIIKDGQPNRPARAVQ